MPEDTDFLDKLLPAILAGYTIAFCQWLAYALHIIH